jgi:hypothetical protein
MERKLQIIYHHARNNSMDRIQFPSISNKSVVFPFRVDEEASKSLPTQLESRRLPKIQRNPRAQSNEEEKLRTPVV